ncbi:MAG: proline--tRNA ligase [Paracoccaceae bacterium]
MSRRNALRTTRTDNFAEWYQEVIDAAEMGEHSGVRGCMIIRPWGFAIWERVQRHLDDMIRETGHDNCYFPIFIPMELIEKEAEHVAGFAKEMAVVTHHRLAEGADGALEPSGALEQPLIVRPTSEAMITEAFQRWIKSYRDLPIKLNQWANVVRWEMRPRLFLRTSEFLWQEGHTAHETAEEAAEEVALMLECYRKLVEDFMGIPVIPGEKSEGERFPGAVATHTIEAMMQDGRALQAGTSHNLGTNFARASGISFLGRDSQQGVPHTTSWGSSTRLIGALIMVHGDDDGLRLPPRLAPQQVVIVPIDHKDETRDAVHAYCDAAAIAMRGLTFADEPIRVIVDHRDDTPSNKRWGWIKKGVPLVIEIGPKDLESDKLAVHRRDALIGKATFHAKDTFVSALPDLLDEIQTGMRTAADAWREEKIVTNITSLDEMRRYFETNLGFVRAKWCEDVATEETLKELGVTVRCLPYDQDGVTGTCIVTGAPATRDAIFAKAY